VENQLNFFEYQKPALDSGEYSITVQQTICLTENKNSQNQYTFPPNGKTTSINVSVYGERFSLDPAAVHAMFPPEGSLGDHSTVMTHIALKRLTFPWERSANVQNDPENSKLYPWVALLLFDETEINKGDVIQQIVTLNEISTKSVTLPDGKETKAYFPEVIKETGQKDSDKITIIDVKKSLLEAMMPTGEELKLLTHVRKGGETDTPRLKLNQGEETGTTELAVVVGNRLPKAESGSSVFLVSVENRYNGTTFDYKNAQPDDYIRLVSFKSWSFACTEKEGKTFKELIEGIRSGTIQYPQPKYAKPADTNPLKKYLYRGYLPLPHYLRNGDFTYSWYHSPLTNQMVNPEFCDSKKNMPEFGDALLRYLSDMGMLDVSYAAAFELGRVLAIESPTFSSTLYQWKHNLKTAFHEKSQETIQPSDVLLFKSSSKRVLCELHPPDVIETWFEELAVLKHIPFNYLVPDEQMLPSESIRFFKMDLHWQECLFWGTLSIGPPLGGNDGLKKDVLGECKNWLSPRLSEKSGFILRSAIVSGYPDVMADARNGIPENGNLKIIRMECLAPDVLFCLFDGDINTVDLYLKPEGIHFGVEGKNDGYIKNINQQEVNIPLKNKEKRIVQIEETAANVKKLISQTMNSAIFGKYMLEKSYKGRFTIKEQ